MSSKRGRKRNDNLPPNRARDVQRAFRARRAAHLQALELRVSELEEENDCLRQALNLPPASRPPLGKGPTGKDKPRALDLPGTSGGGVSQSVNSLLSSRESSSADSPSSTRAGSQSPPLLSAAPRSAQPSLDGGPSWDQGMLINEQHNGTGTSGHHHHHHSVDSNTYHQLPPMSAPPQQGKPHQQLPYQYTSSASPVPPSRTPSLPNSVYMSYSHSADRPSPMANSSYPGPSSSSSYSVRGEDDPRHYTSYPPPSSYDSPTSLHHHHNHHHLQAPAAHRETSSSPAIPYPPRRESGNTYFSQLPNPTNSSHSIRLPSPPGGLITPQQQQQRAYESRMHPMS